MPRKLLILVLVVLVGGTLGAPYVFGSKAEQIHREFSGKLAASGSIAVKSSEFNKGWFRSSARDVVELCSTGAGCKELVISSVLHHGPIAVTGIMDGVAPMRPLQAVMITTMRLDDMFREAQLKPGLPDIKVTSLAELDGSSRATMEMPASKHSAEGKAGKVTVALGGLTGDFTGNAGSERVTGQMSFPSLKIEGEDGFVMTLSNLSADVDGEGSDSGFIGKVNEKIGGITVSTQANDPHPFALKGLAITIKGSRSGDGLSQTQFNGGIQSITAVGREYGPATMEGEMLRVNQQAMTRMQKDLERLEAQKKPPQEMLPEMMAIYQKAVPEILGSRPEFNLKSFNLKTPEGDILTSFKLVGVPPQGELNMAAWMKLLQADLSLQLPAVTLWNILDMQMQQAAHKAAAVTGQAPVVPSQDEIGAKVTELVNNNVFVPKLDANAYSLQLAFLEGKLLINGQESEDFASLAQLLGQQPAPPAVQAPTPTP